MVAKDADGAVLADVVVGKPKSGHASPALYVRRHGEDQSWLVEGSIRAASALTSWVERKVLGIPADRMRGVDITHPDGEVLSVSRPDDTETSYDVAGVPEGRELSTPYAPSSVATALNYVSLEDVVPVGEIDFGGATRSTWRTFDGLVATAETVERDGVHWTRFEFAYEESEEVGPVAPPEEGEQPETPDEADASAAIRAEVEELAAAHAAWAYAVGRSKAEAFTKRLEELLAEPDPVEPELPALELPVDGPPDESGD